MNTAFTETKEKEAYPMSVSQYPSRVTQGEDGAYRWSYDMDMYKNHYLLNVLLKVFGIIGLFCVGMMLFLFVQGHDLTLRIALIILACYAGLMGLVAGGYYLAALLMHGGYHLQFCMTEDEISLVRGELGRRVMDAAALLTSPANAAAASGVTRFKEVRGMKEHREYDAFNLRTLYGGNQIWVPEQDYEFVRDYVLSRIPVRP